MSTRATITVRDERDTFSIYHHSDGYPEHIFPKLREAMTYAWEMPRFEAMDFAAAIVAACKKQCVLHTWTGQKPYRIGGGGVYFTKGRDHHGDTEWHYDVSYSGGSPFEQQTGHANGRKGKPASILVRAFQRDYKAPDVTAEGTTWAQSPWRARPSKTLRLNASDCPPLQAMEGYSAYRDTFQARVAEILAIDGSDVDHMAAIRAALEIAEFPARQAKG